MTDRLIRATAARGGIRAVGAIATTLTNEARRRHKLSAVATAALGRTMTSGLLLASGMKRPQSRINIRVSGNGPIGAVFADAGLDGTVRGYVSHPELELPPNAKGKLDVGRAVGHNGFLDVMKDVGFGTPYSSTVELVSGAIGDDVAHYLFSSEQTPSALILGEFVDRTGVAASGGLLLQIMPKAARDESLIQLLESRVSRLSGFTALLQQGKSLEEMLGELLQDLEPIVMPGETELRFQCRCSFDRVLGAIRMLGEDELRDMIEKDNGAEATCHFCSNIYRADRQQLEQIIDDLLSDRQAQALEL